MGKSTSRLPESEGATPVPEPEPPVNGRPAPAPVDTIPATEPALKMRIDPKDLVLDWDVDGYSDPEEAGPQATWDRPAKDTFYRAHPTWSIGVYLLDCSRSMGLGSEFIVSKAVARRLMDEEESVTAVTVYLLANRDRGYLFWPVKLGDPTEQSKPSEYVKSARAAIALAREDWTKIVWRSGKGSNGYHTRKARTEIDDPAWPDDPLMLFMGAVDDRYIAEPDHPVVLKYLGLA